MIRYTIGVLVLTLFVAFCAQAQGQIDQDKLSVEVGLGIGKTENPILGGKDIPLYVLPNIAWYGEHWYFDNLELGYQWQIAEESALELLLSPNKENLFFSDSGTISVPGTSSFIDRGVTLNDIEDRDWSLDFGVRAHRYFDTGELALAYYRDISNVHQGSHLIASYTHHWRWQKWHAKASLLLHWKDRQLVDYYYGIDQQDNVPREQFYSPGAALQPQVGFSLSRPLTNHWQLIGVVKYLWLDDDVSDSPVVKQSGSATFFFGAFYTY